MGQPEKVGSLVRQGYTPSEISSILNISVSTTEGYLARALFAGCFRKSDIFLAHGEICCDFVVNFVSDVQIQSILTYRDAISHFDIPQQSRLISALNQYSRQDLLGDTYYYVSTIERHLASSLVERLKSEYGDDLDAWWRKGVKPSIRAKCAATLEEDDQPYYYEPFRYITLRNLISVANDNWSHMSDLFNCSENEKRQTLELFNKAAAVRNRVMHAVKDFRPTYSDFIVVGQSLKMIKSCRNILGPVASHSPDAIPKI